MWQADRLFISHLFFRRAAACLGFCVQFWAWLGIWEVLCLVAKQNRAGCIESFHIYFSSGMSDPTGFLIYLLVFHLLLS